jgi:6-phosphofructokinase 1
MIKRIGILTGGGDAPGLNAVIRAVTLTACERYGWDVVGIREGFDGLLAGLPTIDLTAEVVTDLLSRGGTILGAANRGNPFARPMELPDGSVEYVDVSEEAIERMNELQLDALICAGGDGTMAIAEKLVNKGARIVGVPKTIDNDLGATDVTFGFDTAVRTATEALAKLQTTAESHHRVMVLELMGRNAGWIALFTGIAGGADAILIPEIPYSLEKVCERINEIRESGRRYSLVAVAEGAQPAEGDQVFKIEGEAEHEKRLGGIGHDVGAYIADCTGAEVRVTVLGHVQRGGAPTPRDRYLATGFGTEAVHLVAEEKWGYMVALRGVNLEHVPMSEAVEMKFVDPAGSWVQIARDLGIVLGD